MYEYQIGISYAKEQETLAERLYLLLTENGIKVFLIKKNHQNSYQKIYTLI